jgi:hypothetical protein
VTRLRSGAFWLFALFVCTAVFAVCGRESDRQQAACEARGGSLVRSGSGVGYVCEATKEQR